MAARAFPPYPGEGNNRAWPPIGSAAKSQLLLPSMDIAAWEDPNSLLSAITWDGTFLNVTLQNPAAARDTPQTGAAYVVPLLNFLGQAPAASLNAAAIRHPIIRFDSATGCPADTWCAVVPINASTVAAATGGLGIQVVGNGTGMSVRRATPSSVAGAASYDATLRYAMMNTASSAASFSGIRGMAACGYATGTTGLFSSSVVDVTTTYSNTTANYVCIAVGWLAGIGVSGSVVRFRPSFFGGTLANLPGI